jgi:thioesterase superfamily protein
MGTLHVGILCDIADVAMGMAFASTLRPDESSTTVELKINFLRPIWQVQPGLKESSYSEGGPSVTSR